MTPRIVAIGFYGSLVAPAAVGIEIATFDWSAHCWGATDQGTIIDATKQHGVKERQMFNPIGPPWATRMEIKPLRHATTRQQQELYRLVKAEEGKPYDDDWIWGYPFNRDWQDDDAWVCSELYGAKMAELGLIVLPNKLRRLTPGKLRQALI